MNRTNCLQKEHVLFPKLCASSRNRTLEKMTEVSNRTRTHIRLARHFRRLRKTWQLGRTTCCNSYAMFLLQKQYLPLVLSSIWNPIWALRGDGQHHSEYVIKSITTDPLISKVNSTRACARHDITMMVWRLFNLVFILRSEHLFYTLLSLVYVLRMDSVLND